VAGERIRGRLRDTGCVSTRPGPDGLCVVHLQELGYARLGDTWGLVVRTADYSQVLDGQDWVWHDTVAMEIDRKSLLRSSRILRLRVIDFMPDLIRALKQAAIEMIASLERAKKIAESFE